MSWTLILTFALTSSHPYGGGGVSVTSVGGFKDEKSCLDAGWKTPKPAAGKYQQIELLYVCVPQEEVK